MAISGFLARSRKATDDRVADTQVLMATFTTEAGVAAVLDLKKLGQSHNVGFDHGKQILCVHGYKVDTPHSGEYFSRKNLVTLTAWTDLKGCFR